MFKALVEVIGRMKAVLMPRLNLTGDVEFKIAVLSHMRNVEKRLIGIEASQKESKAWQKESKAWQKAADNKLNAIKTWQKTIDDFKPVWNRAGKSFELGVRETIRRKKGDDFVQNSNVENIYALTKVAFPAVKPIQGEGFKNFDRNRDETLLYIARTEKLVESAFPMIDSLVNWSQKNAESPDSNIRGKAQSVLNRVAQFNAIKGYKEKNQFLASSPLGLHLLSHACFVDADKNGFMKTLEFDMRGTVKTSGNFVKWEIAEVKIGTGYEKAIKQLLKRFALFHFAAQCVLGSSEYKALIMQFNGVIFTDNKKWTSPSSEKLSKILKAGSLILPLEKVSVEVQHIF